MDLTKSYTTQLDMPVLGMPRRSALSLIEAAIVGDPRVEWFRAEPWMPGDGAHVSATVRIRATSDASARHLAEELHDRAMDQVLASMPDDGRERGWTSGFQMPERVED